jgi:hypothetical protein
MHCPGIRPLQLSEINVAGERNYIGMVCTCRRHSPGSHVSGPYSPIRSYPWYRTLKNIGIIWAHLVLKTRGK